MSGSSHSLSVLEREKSALELGTLHDQFFLPKFLIGHAIGIEICPDCPDMRTRVFFAQRDEDVFWIISAFEVGDRFEFVPSWSLSVKNRER
jgi:hypothetical protein